MNLIVIDKSDSGMLVFALMTKAMVHVHYTLVEHLERCDSDGLHWKYPLWSVIQKVSFTLLLLLWPFISVILLNM